MESEIDGPIFTKTLLGWVINGNVGNNFTKNYTKFLSYL